MAQNDFAKWTPEEDRRLRELFEAGVSKFLIAVKLKRAVTAVSARAHALKISTKRVNVGLKAKK